MRMGGLKNANYLNGRNRIVLMVKSCFQSSTDRPTAQNRKRIVLLSSKQLTFNKHYINCLLYSINQILHHGPRAPHGSPRSAASSLSHYKLSRSSSCIPHCLFIFSCVCYVPFHTFFFFSVFFSSFLFASSTQQERKKPTQRIVITKMQTTIHHTTGVKFKSPKRFS